ncbi:hypothetical protein B0H63DRAFT_249920 [Podospora didyma]|uniref:CSI2 protein n=1 Tax=Podospora didyma TaxID=330526 RepID=A0AAE0KLV6_9PEZI|nr:hypothetical protein B0H63DRAFT_249920 [Podospora didyma]
MGLPRLSLKRSLLFSAFFAAAILTGGTLAQDDTTTQTGRNGQQTTTTRPTTSTSSTTTRTTSSTSASPPATTSSTSTGSRSFQTGLPPVTVTNGAGGPVPVYPAPTVPPTQNAPFMNHSTLPDGTVFIAVGAILGAFGLTVLAWRAIVACLLHRSVERAMLAQHAENDKAATFPTAPAPFYQFLQRDRDSSPSLPAGPAGRGQRRTNRGPTPSATPSQTNLFFSPTAQAGSSGLGNPGNRESRFLPSGFYASSSAAAVPLASHSHGNSISMTNLRPASRGGAPLINGSPPESPDMGPRRTSRNFSSSSVNLNRPPSGRPPSAFLDDLLDDRPGQYNLGPSAHLRYSQSPSPPGQGPY